jgi:hypothetical protein
VVRIRNLYITGIPADFRSELLVSDFVICKEQTTSIKRGFKPCDQVIELLEKSTGKRRPSYRILAKLVSETTCSSTRGSYQLHRIGKRASHTE